MGKSDEWDYKEKVEHEKGMFLIMTCKHVSKKSIPPDPEWFPELICKKCSKKMSDPSIDPKEQNKDLFLLCPECLSNDNRNKPFWKDWYKILLKKYEDLGYDSVPCMDDLKSHPPLNDCDCGVCKGDINEIKDPGKPDEFGCYIKQYFHCKKCLSEKPKDQSAAEWARLNVGFTAKGLEVWCMRHNVSVANLDFKGNTPEYC